MGYKTALRRWALCGTMFAALAAPLPSAAQTSEAEIRASIAPAARVHPEIWPQANWPFQRDAAMEARIDALIARMTIEEKVGQLVQADIGSVTPEEVKRYNLGSVLNGGNSGPYGDEYAGPDRWLALADEFYDASVDTSDGGVGIPVIWGTDAVHGHSNVVGATLFPHNVGLGAAHDPALMRRIAEATAVEIRVTGQEWTFAPTITVPQDVRWGRAYEGYSSDPALVQSYVGEFIRGLQGEPGAGAILAGPHVLASTKHFLADGGTFEGRDQGDARITEEQLRDIHGRPYLAAIDAGVQTVMASFSSWNGEKVTGHPGLLTDVLKERMGFGGFIVSDWNAHGQVTGCTNATCPRAVNAGLDMYMAPDSWRQIHDSLLAQARDGTVPAERLDDAVRNILRVKMRAGLFEAGRPSSRPLSGDYDRLGSANHRAIAREAVRKSLVLIKNEGSVLPLRPGANILVAGDGADDVARQSGGWTLTWQGTGIPDGKFPGATSIWNGIEQAVAAGGGRATLSADGRYSGAKPDAAIVVFGETPYAEFQGDIATLQLKPELRAPLETMRRLKAEGVPVVAVFLSGRPLWMNEWLNASDAFVAAWLPGSEGGGVADVLFQRPAGGVAHDFTGSLSFAWPATANATGPVLFPLGYGLSYAEGGTVPRLPEDAGVAETAASGVFFDRGVPSAAHSLQITDGAADITRITTVPATVLRGRVQVTSTDHVVQEGARRFAIRGGGPAVVEVTAPGGDWTREANGDSKLTARIRLDAAPTREVFLGLGDERVSLGRMEAFRPGQWTTVGIDLKCFGRLGADLANVSAPFRLSTDGDLTFSLARVALGYDAETVVRCPE
ncbi:glycoside hydrolase family 3 protein [Sphingomonas jejuensis]|nr:glycoside hydrolase family 3 protein [Sphingomonas jejuensis]